MMDERLPSVQRPRRLGRANSDPAAGVFRMAARPLARNKADLDRAKGQRGKGTEQTDRRMATCRTKPISGDRQQGSGSWRQGCGACRPRRRVLRNKANIAASACAASSYPRQGRRRESGWTGTMAGTRRGARLVEPLAQNKANFTGTGSRQQGAARAGGARYCGTKPIWREEGQRHTGTEQTGSQIAMCAEQGQMWEESGIWTRSGPAWPGTGIRRRMPDRTEDSPRCGWAWGIRPSLL
jgi:hypothetical protein